MPPARRRRRKVGTLEQLSFTLAAAPPPEHPVEVFDVGYFTGVRMSTGVYWVTVGLKKRIFEGQQRTPQTWWRDVAPELFTLHGWSDDKRYVQNEADDDETPPQSFKTRSQAMRWLRVFNEAFQEWRMEVRA